MLKRRVVLGFGIGALVARVASTTACSTSDAPSGMADGGAQRGPCDITTDTTCVSESLGVFVDVLRGSDSNAGTKAAPVQTIRVGLSNAKAAGKTSVYVCEGTYTENVVVNNAVSIYGGLDCLTWMYVGKEKRPKIVSKSRGGAAVEVRAADQAVNVLDVDVLATDGVDGATDNTINSIGMFVAQAAQVTLRRVSLTAANGGKGADAPAPASNMRGDAGARDGMSSSDSTGAMENPCLCGEGRSLGGGGGGAGLSGRAGGASLLDGGVVMGGDGGVGGTVTTNCTVGQNGSNGVAPGSAPANLAGRIDTGGWHPGAGANGLSAEPATGGGGGGGNTTPFARCGAGGGCGGCGGAGGRAGSGGGASIGLLLFDSLANASEVSAAAATGGHGGQGGAGEVGGGGGSTGGTVGGCAGGAGGAAAGGGGGQGGAGGVSVAIAYASREPVLGAEISLKPGNAGAPGAGGQGGAGGQTGTLPAAPAGPIGTLGPAGIAAQSQAFP